MLGCRLQNSDVYLFLENDEDKLLGTQSVSGVFVGATNTALEASIDTLCDLFDITFSAEQVAVRMRREAYEWFMANGVFSLHEGYRHVNLRHARSLGFEDSLLYESLKYAVRSL
jgi:hypothetical protein